MRVLIVEDDEALSQFLRKSLAASHYEADVAADGERARELVEQQEYDLVILDLNLPKADGLEVLRHIRARNTALPVVALTARREVQDRVKALDLGADDYLAKPFAFAELSARVRALLRRSQQPAGQVLRVEDLELNRVERRVSRSGTQIDLTPKEIALLEYLMQNEGRCVTRTMIIENVWKMHSDTITNVVDVYVNYLRKKVDEGFEPKLIHTVRGAGYRLGLRDENVAVAAGLE
jgi:two-component system, OmpR family, copper resistance phosphate regulon response regulator CusR